MEFIGPNHVVNGVWPLADFYESGPVYSQAVNMGVYGHATFIISEGAGGTGTTTITVCAGSTIAGTTSIAFKYRVCTTQDTWGALTDATAAAGYPTVAGANKMIAIEVDAEDLPADKPYIRLCMTELVDAVCLGSMIIILTEARFPQAIPVTAIT